jgi:hypothetical protein
MPEPNSAKTPQTGDPDAPVESLEDTVRRSLLGTAHLQNVEARAREISENTSKLTPPPTRVSEDELPQAAP